MFVININMLQNEIDLILEKYKSVQDESNIDIDAKKADLNKDGKLSGYEQARGKAISKSINAEDEEVTDIVKTPRRKISSFEKYKLGQAKRFLRNNDKINKMLSVMNGMTSKDAQKIVKKYS